MIGAANMAVPAVMDIVNQFKAETRATLMNSFANKLLARLATEVPGVYVPCILRITGVDPVPNRKTFRICWRIKRAHC